jgi:hypothetical protein
MADTLAEDLRALARTRLTEAGIDPALITVTRDPDTPLSVRLHRRDGKSQILVMPAGDDRWMVCCTSAPDDCDCGYSTITTDQLRRTVGP